MRNDQVFLICARMPDGPFPRGKNHRIFQSSERATGSLGPIYVHLADQDSKHDHAWLQSEWLYPIFL